MLGKLLGMTGVSLTMAAVYLGGALWAAYHYEFAEYVPAGLLVWFFVFQVLASLMYGSLFIAIGAACSDMRETQNFLWPVMFLAMLPLFVIVSVLQEPNSAVSTGLSFFPFATPSLMIARQAVPPGIAWWQPTAGAAGVLLTTLLCVWAAGRVFRIGLLMQGKGARLGEIARWVFRG
jgi:ABC-type Na+ efflux pump permease subunit